MKAQFILRTSRRSSGDFTNLVSCSKEDDDDDSYAFSAFCFSWNGMQVLFFKYSDEIYTYNQDRPYTEGQK